MINKINNNNNVVYELIYFLTKTLKGREIKLEKETEILNAAIKLVFVSFSFSLL